VALTVRDIMEVDVPSVYPEDPIEKVLRTMRDHDLPGVPVINEGGRCVGIITEADLVMREEQSDLHSRTSSSCGAT
jgi:CBS domain-containing protein